MSLRSLVCVGDEWETAVKGMHPGHGGLGYHIAFISKVGDRERGAQSSGDLSLLWADVVHSSRR